MFKPGQKFQLGNSYSYGKMRGKLVTVVRNANDKGNPDLYVVSCPGVGTGEFVTLPASMKAVATLQRIEARLETAGPKAEAFVKTAHDTLLRKVLEVLDSTKAKRASALKPPMIYAPNGADFGTYATSIVVQTPEPDDFTDIRGSRLNRDSVVDKVFQMLKSNGFKIAQARGRQDESWYKKSGGPGGTTYHAIVTARINFINPAICTYYVSIRYK